MEPNKEDTVTIQEVLNDVNREILFVSKCSNIKDIDSCTYSKGYHSQEIFACLTCYKETSKYAALCVGCAFTCHKDHEVIDLYFKRQIRCDCGNSKFVIPCSYIEKQYDNPENVYNRNYEGKYCYCGQDESEGNMIQCIICEDWYHEDHLSFERKIDKLPETNEEVNLICKKCIDRMSFLQDYPIEEFLIPKVDKEGDDDSKQNLTGGRKYSQLDQSQHKDISFSNKKTKSKEEACINNEDNKEPSNYNISNEEKNISDKISICRRDILRSSYNKERFHLGRTYDTLINIKSLTGLICKCPLCLENYESLSMSFLCDDDYYSELITRTRLEEKLEKEVEEDTDENKNILNTLNEVNLFQLNDVKRLDVEKQMALSLVMKKFKEDFGDFISNLNPENGIVTKEHVDRFLLNFKKDNPLLDDLN